MPRHGWREPRAARRVSCRTRALDAKTNARRGDGELRRLVYACGFGRGLLSRRDAERARAHDGCAHGSPRFASPSFEARPDRELGRLQPRWSVHLHGRFEQPLAMDAASGARTAGDHRIKLN
mmetsp:Transcript_5824/g.18247  ORF Transcript_5824/g.18247 Transcript_5824/m.18247 type:complete len:122 (+) Transcript_5824:936-1301(+)